MRLPDRLENAYVVELEALHQLWQRTHENALMNRMNGTCQKLLAIRPGNYEGHLIAAICAFVLSRELRTAKREIRQCRTSKDRTWYYSKAFLHAYEGEMKSAISTYDAAFARPPANPSVPLQCEQFIIYILSQEEDKIQLYFCMGLINLRAKDDEMAARRAFSEFLARCPKDQYQPEQLKAQEYINGIDEHDHDQAH